MTPIQCSVGISSLICIVGMVNNVSVGIVNNVIVKVII